MRLVYFVDQYPELSETFLLGELLAMRALGREVRIESARRAKNPNPEAEGGPPVRYLDEEGRGSNLSALAWLVRTHPVRVVRDLGARLRWRREEPVLPLRRLAPLARRVVEGRDEHIHAHFAAGAALDALRVSRLTGVPYSVTTHGYDIWLHPRNLREKLESARMHFAVSDYNAKSVGRWAPERMHVIVMGVDPERFRRSKPYPGGQTVVSVGRFVEKKGFPYLVEAARLLPDVRFRIVGDGHLRAGIQAGAPENVEFLGALPPQEVRAVLEDADLFALACVVAEDGDRDAMPVVVKEALAMEIPVVGSDEVAMPEVVKPEWGRLVPPRDPEALASAIQQLLALPPETRAEMGRRGREFVAEHFSIDGEARKLADLLEMGL